MAKTSQQFQLVSFIKFCISGEKIQSLTNLREKVNQARTVVKEPCRQLTGRKPGRQCRMLNDSLTCCTFQFGENCLCLAVSFSSLLKDRKKQ